MMYDFIKRVIDILGALVGLIIFSPFMFGIALLIKLDSEGPVFADTPKRVGKDGKLFRMFKFRSMVKNAHQMLYNDPKMKDLLEQLKKNSYKLQDDPRITRVGKLIRKTSFDELPQFINILFGDMSLVGPRAYYPFELEEQQQKYPDTREYVKIILTAKPGLTGLWQISGRSQINFEARVKLDAEYVLKRNILFDAWIIIQTIPAAITGRGAI